MTLLLTTQYLEEADALAHTIAVVDQGRIIARGTADELKAQVGGERIEVVVHTRDDIGRAVQVLSSESGADAVACAPWYVQLRFHGSQQIYAGFRSAAARCR